MNGWKKKWGKKEVDGRKSLRSFKRDVIHINIQHQHKFFIKILVFYFFQQFLDAMDESF